MRGIYRYLQYIGSKGVFRVFPLLSGLIVLVLRAQHLGVVKVPSSSNSFKKKFEKIYNAEQNQVAALYVSIFARTWKLFC